MTKIIICRSCKSNFTGQYCNSCGEKVVESSDFKLWNIINQAIGSITNFDSKIYQTLKLLIFFPGKLSTKFIEGNRVPYMKPFQVFVISNILFFLFLSELDLFRTPSKWFFIEDFDGIRVLDMVRNIASSKNLNQPEVALLYDNRSSNLSKGLIVILIPFIALVSMLMNFGKKVEFGKHIIFSTHYFAFVLFLCVINSALSELFNIESFKWYFIISTTTLMCVYYTIASKNFYNLNTWLHAIVKGLFGVFLINLIFQFYRVGINLLSLNTI